MEITKISKQVKNADRYSVFVDGKYAFSLSSGALLASGLVNGMRLTPEQVVEYKRQSGTDKLLQACLGLIARRPRSVWEVSEYLKRKSVVAQEAQEILNKLSNMQYLDDARFAQSWVESRRLLKSVSKRRLEMELRAKRVPDEIIRRTLVDDETDEKTVLATLVEKKREQSRYQDDTKLMQYLVRQGFNYADIKQVLTTTED